MTPGDSVHPGKVLSLTANFNGVVSRNEHLYRKGETDAAQGSYVVHTVSRCLQNPSRAGGPFVLWGCIRASMSSTFFGCSEAPTRQHYLRYVA